MDQPRAYRGIMVSSTFSDLAEHRREVIQAIEKLGFRANVMEMSGAQTEADVIDTSLGMVRDSAAFVGVISHRYGQTPVCSSRNPKTLSISELEFNEAMRLSRPILLFIMGEEHPGTKSDFENDQDKISKLDAFRKRAKKMREGGSVERIYEVFNSREEFTRAATIAIGKLSQSLSPLAGGKSDANVSGSTRESIETALPPELRAVPRYLGSHEFVGRKAELDTLDDWCAAADTHPMLLFEAIGGTGKSMVTWTWMTGRAEHVRADWAGRFWYSFYEGGATMSRFCQEALAYMTGQPAKVLYKEKTQTLIPRLVAELEAKPWLIVLDGIERILVAYHRLDASQIRDEEVEVAEDQIANRDPRATINPEDEELLRLLTAAAPSKILVTSRLTPKALVNPSGMPMPGVWREMLPGLRPADAEALLHACGVNGDSNVIRDYLQRNCDCHPLVIGALAGLVNNYMRDRGSFDAWLSDPNAGGKLGLADMDLTQRRNHILDTAVEALSKPGRRLLQTLSLLQAGADYATLKEFNPHRPPPPKEVKEPSPPEKSAGWKLMSDAWKEKAKASFEEAKKARATYLEALRAWEEQPEVLAAPAQFDETLAELERRGLLQYEHGHKVYNLHPVVRGVLVGGLDADETGTIGAHVVDYFSSRPHDPWEQAKTLEDLGAIIQIVMIQNRMGDFDAAFKAYQSGLGSALHKLMALTEVQRLLQPIFPEGWCGPVALKSEDETFDALTTIVGSFRFTDISQCELLSERAVECAVLSGNEINVRIGLRNHAWSLFLSGKIADSLKFRAVALKFSEAVGTDAALYESLVRAYVGEIFCGRHEEAAALWSRLNPNEKDWGKSIDTSELLRYRAFHLFWRGMLSDADLTTAEQSCRSTNDRFDVIQCLGLRGDWHLSRGEPSLAIEPLSQAVRLCRDSGLDDAQFEARLASACIRAGRPINGRAIAERFADTQDNDGAIAVAELWRDLGEPTYAIAAALRAYKMAWGSGEPFVYRFVLNSAKDLLLELGELPPDLPKYDPADNLTYDWEDDVTAMIDKAREKREERERKRAESIKKGSD